MTMHILVLIGIIVANLIILAIVVALVLWLVKRDAHNPNNQKIYDRNI